DWSSDVCSSDLELFMRAKRVHGIHSILSYNRTPNNHNLALIMVSATSAASFRGQNVQASDQYGIRGLWSPSSVAEIGRCGDRSPGSLLISAEGREEGCMIWKNFSN